MTENVAILNIDYPSYDICIIISFIAPDKRGYPHITFISPQKHVVGTL